VLLHGSGHLMQGMAICSASFENRTYWHPGILGGILESLFDNILREPGKVGMQLSEILFIFNDLVFMGLV
jgi:hypothetical protein